MYLVLPRESVVNKIVSFGSPRCDIFTDAVVDNTREQVDDFVRLIENVSKLKRQNGRKARVSWLSINFEFVILFVFVYFNRFVKPSSSCSYMQCYSTLFLLQLY